MRVRPEQLTCSMKHNKWRENCFGLGVALCGSPRWSTSVHESEAAVIPPAKIFGQHDQRSCVFCSALFYVLCFVCSALLCATAATARLHARQGNRNLQTMVQLFTCYIVCRLSQCLLKEDAWPAGQQQSGVRLIGAGRGRSKVWTAGWEDAAVWRSNTVEKSASWFD